jgi:hypothetical protein
MVGRHITMLTVTYTYRGMDVQMAVQITFFLDSREFVDNL